MMRPPKCPESSHGNYCEASTSPLAEQGGIFSHARPLARLPTTHIHPSITHTSIPIRFTSARQSKPSPAPLQSTHPPIRRAKRRVPQTQHGPPRRNHTTHDDDHDDGPTRALLYNRRVHTPTRPSAGGVCVCAQGLYVVEGGGGAKQERWMDARWMGGWAAEECEQGKKEYNEKEKGKGKSERERERERARNIFGVRRRTCAGG